MSAVKNVFKLIDDHEIRFVDFRFSDMRGCWHHITTDVNVLEDKTFEEGLNFDGSSVEGWRPINSSDMFYRPDAESAFVDPFMTHPTLVLICDIVNPNTGKQYNRCPRSIARRAEEYLVESGIADSSFYGPELEFFVFDNVLYNTTTNESFYHIDAATGAWNRGEMLEQGNTGHVAGLKGGYFKMPPLDRAHDMRSEMMETLKDMGIAMRLHHSEVATAGQCELGMDADSPVKKGDQVHMMKYAVHNVADIYGQTATFMPKPLGGDNGNGMHVHQSLWKDGKNLFAGNNYAGLSDMALHYLGGIIKHGKALNAFTNPLTNSYKRLIPGFEAPVILAYASCNRSAAIRIPAGSGDNSRRIETRFPDAGANPYMGIAALMMAGLDGIKNKIDPGEAREDDLYELSDAELAKLPQVCGSLEEALDALEADHAFLTEGGVFDEDMIKAYIELKREDVNRLNHTPHPVEFEMYYSV